MHGIHELNYLSFERMERILSGYVIGLFIGMVIGVTAPVSYPYLTYHFYRRSQV